MALRPLKSFFLTADELLKQDLSTLGGVLLEHLKSYQGLNTVYQHAGLHRGYFRAMLENRNVGLGPLPKEPEYGIRQPDVTKRMMEAWNWLERQGLLIHNDQQMADWFNISSEGEKYLHQEKLPRSASANPARISRSVTDAPRALLSYSWDGPEHQQWVREFAERLQGESGVEIIFDQWHLNPGDDKLHFMEQAVAQSNFVIVVCTPTYAERADKRQGGVGYESMVITGELAEHILTNKFIPVLRKGTWTLSMPVYLKSRMGVNLSDQPYHEDEYEKLLRVLHGEPIQPQPPPVGRKPDFSRKPASEVKRSAMSEATGPRPDVSSNPGPATTPAVEAHGRLTVQARGEARPQGSRSPNGKSRAVPISAQSKPFDEGRKRGRRTIPDNFLLGARNAWVALLEEFWSEIGWPLVCIRNHRTGSVEEIRQIFEPVKDGQHNPGLAAPFYRQGCKIGGPDDVRKNRGQLGKLEAEIIAGQAQYERDQMSCLEVDRALKVASTGDQESIREEGRKRQIRLVASEDRLKALKSQHDSLDSTVRDQESYVFRSQLLDFLHSGRLALNPRNLANALAGLPLMGWRQSLTRCSGMPFDPQRLEYSVLELISEVWRRRRKEFDNSPLEFFRAGVLKLPRNSGYPLQFLWDHWRDLRRAIDKCWESTRSPDSIPFALTSIFMGFASQPKDPAERILAEQEKITPLKRRGVSARS